MSPRTETGCEAGDPDEFAPQNEVRRSASHVPSRATAAGSPQESAEVVVARDTGWEQDHPQRGGLKGPDGLTYA